MISKRARIDGEPNALSRALANKQDYIDLTASNPTTVNLDYDTRMLEGFSDPRMLVYEPASLGLPDARAFVAQMEKTTPDRVMLTASTSESYSILLKLLCDPDDEILVPRPSYPLFGPLASFEGVRTVPYSLRYDGAWHVDRSTLRKSDRTRAIFCVSPNNPTGSMLAQDELDAMADLGLPIVVDEVFAEYMFRPTPRPKTDRVNVFRLGGLSKSCLLPQMKLAWTIVEGPSPPMRELEWLNDAFLSASTPVQRALPRLYELAKPTREGLRARIQANLDRLRERTKNTALTVLDVRGGWYACVRLPNTRTEEEWVLSLLDKDVLVHPGHFFDFEEEPIVVLSLIVRPDEFRRGIDILVRNSM